MVSEAQRRASKKYKALHKEELKSKNAQYRRTWYKKNQEYVKQKNREYYHNKKTDKTPTISFD